MILHTTGRTEKSLPFAITVTFDEHEPDVCRVQFHTHPRGADWRIGRDLLADGLMSETGEGDITIRPAYSTDEVEIEISTPSGHAVVYLVLEPIASFVRRTYQHVDRGAEYAAIDWDALPWRERAAGGAW